MSAIAQATPANIAGQAFKVANIGGGQSRHELSRQWIARPADQRYLSLSELEGAMLKRRQASTETKIETKKIELLAPEATDTASLQEMMVGLPDGTERGFTHWSFGQICRLAKSPADHYRELPSQIASDALNYRLRYAREIDQIKTYATSTELMAVTGPDYGRIFDHEIVDAVRLVAGNGTGDERWKIPGVMDWRTMMYDPHHPVTLDTTTLFASDSDIFIFLVDDLHPIEIGRLPNGEPDYIFRGFYITNSEMGKKRLVVACFYLRGICCNRIMWGVEGFQEISIVHSKGGPARFIEEIRPALTSYANGSVQKLVDGVEKAKAAKVAADNDEAMAFLNNRGLSRKRVLAVLETCEKEEGHPARSVWDMAQGITAVARSEPNNDTRVDLELQARTLLDKVAA